MLGYWPSFATLSPRCRGAYLNWLASDRNNTTKYSNLKFST
ncbi:TerB N-terminal domain-containing protein [Enterobacter kobei]|nr:TerB N-terminal domain-containing protein [Enterobacter kobei]